MAIWSRALVRACLSSYCRDFASDQCVVPQRRSLKAELDGLVTQLRLPGVLLRPHLPGRRGTTPPPVQAREEPGALSAAFARWPGISQLCLFPRDWEDLCDALQALTPATRLRLTSLSINLVRK